MAFKALSSKIEIWQAFIVLVILIFLVDWLFLKLQVTSEHKKKNG